MNQGHYGHLAGTWVGELPKGHHHVRAQYKSRSQFNFHNDDWQSRNLQVLLLPRGSYMLGSVLAEKAFTLEASAWSDWPELTKTFTVKKKGVVQAFYQLATENNDDYLFARMLVDGTEQRETRSIVGPVRYGTNSGTWIGTLDAGSHTIKIQYRRSGSRALFNGIKATGDEEEWRVAALQVVAMAPEEMKVVRLIGVNKPTASYVGRREQKGENRASESYIVCEPRVCCVCCVCVRDVCVMCV